MYILSIFLVIVLVLFYYYKTTMFTDYLSGVWIGDDDFVKSANIDGMMIYIGKPLWTYTGYKHDCYIIIMNDIYQSKFTIKYSFPIKNTVNISTDISDEVWSGKLKLKLDIINGTLSIFNNEVVYCKLIKNNQISQLTI